MATFNATSQTGGVANFAAGSFTSDNTITDVIIGFRPRWVKVFNVTDVIIKEKVEGMAASTVINTVAAGTTTNNTDSHIQILENGFRMPAAAVGTAKAISWVAIG